MLGQLKRIQGLFRCCSRAVAGLLVSPSALSFWTALLTIVLLTWPWVLHFNGEFLQHWDPPFHAWKLEFMARRILAGDLFFRSANTNMLYPNAGCLYFEALQWPPALFAALLFRLTSLSSEVVYHVTLLFFWALSAPCMYLLLRQLDCGKLVSFSGGVLFCVLPHRISYMAEFQMELIFALPLFFAFVVRFFRRPTPVDGVLAVMSLWVFAVSELYQAVMAAMAAPFVILSFATRNPRQLIRKKFCFSVISAGVVGIISVFVLLLPYLTLHGNGAVIRKLSEIQRHSSQVFSYFQPFGRFSFWLLDVHVDEFSPYPTLALLFLGFLGFLYWMRRHWAERCASRCAFIGAIIACTLSLLFCLACIPAQVAAEFRGSGGEIHPFPFLGWLLLLGCISCVAQCLFHLKGESERFTFLRGLFAASALFFVFSLGPHLAFGEGGNLRFSETEVVDNTLYLLCHSKALPFLSGFRVVSRFGVYILFFLLCVSACILDRMRRRLSAAHARCAAAIPVFVLALVCLEAFPPARMTSTYKKIERFDSPSLNRLRRDSAPKVLTVLPFGDREDEGMLMFSYLRDDLLYTFAWGGYEPPFSFLLRYRIGHLQIEKMFGLLRFIYPDVHVIVDNARPSATLAREDRPYLHYKGDSLDLDWAAITREFADEVDADDRFVHFRFHPMPASNKIDKFFRNDIGRLNPVVHAVLEGDASLPVSLCLNGTPLADYVIPAGGRLTLDHNFEGHPLREYGYNVLSFQTSQTNMLRLCSFSLAAPDGRYIDICGK